MLVLSRGKDDEIWIDRKIRIVVLRCRDGRVRLGIEAPEEVEILRGELLPPPEAEKEGAQGPEGPVR